MKKSTKNGTLYDFGGGKIYSTMFNKMQFASTLRFTFFTLYIAPVTVMEVSRSEILLSRDEKNFSSRGNKNWVARKRKSDERKNVKCKV